MSDQDSEVGIDQFAAIGGFCIPSPQQDFFHGSDSDGTRPAAFHRNASSTSRPGSAAGRKRHERADAEGIIQATIESASRLLGATAVGWWPATDASCAAANGSRRFLERLRAGEPDLIQEKVASKSLEKLLQRICQTGDLLRGKWVVALPLSLKDQCFGSVLLVIRERLEPSDPLAQALHALADHAVIALWFELRGSAECRRARQEERNRIARDLHDRLGQAFGAIILQLEALRAECGLAAEPMLGRIEEVGRLARHGIDEVRRAILTAAGPALLEQRSLSEAFAILASETSRASGVTVKFVNRLENLELGSSVAEQLFAIATEAVHNALRHARPTQIHLSLAPIGKGFRMQIQDNGCGFVRGAALGSSGFGLRSMRERARGIGASFHLRSVLDRGVSLRVTVPEFHPGTASQMRSTTARRRTVFTSPIPPPQPRCGA